MHILQPLNENVKITGWVTTFSHRSFPSLKKIRFNDNANKNFTIIIIFIIFWIFWVGLFNPKNRLKYCVDKALIANSNLQRFQGRGMCFKQRESIYSILILKAVLFNFQEIDRSMVDPSIVQSHEILTLNIRLKYCFSYQKIALFVLVCLPSENNPKPDRKFVFFMSMCWAFTF